MKFHKGDLFYIEMRSGICQVLDVFKADENETVYYFRKIFDGKFRLKISQASLVHESWMGELSKSEKEKVKELLSDPSIKSEIDNLTIDRKMEFGAGIYNCTMESKKKKGIEKQLNAEINGQLNIEKLENSIIELEKQGELHIHRTFDYPPEGQKLYRLAYGRYCDDFDESGKEFYREIRFVEVKMYRREDLIK